MKVASSTKSAKVKTADGREFIRVQEGINPQMFKEEPALLHLQLGKTLTITDRRGNSRWVRIDVGLTVPTLVKDVSKSYAMLKADVEQAIEEETKKYAEDEGTEDLL